MFTVEVWSRKSLDDGQAEQEVSRGYPAFVHNVSAGSQRTVYSIVRAFAYSRRRGMTTGPPPNIIVPISDISDSV